MYVFPEGVFRQIRQVRRNQYCITGKLGDVMFGVRDLGFECLITYFFTRLINSFMSSVSLLTYVTSRLETPDRSSKGRPAPARALGLDGPASLKIERINFGQCFCQSLMAMLMLLQYQC